MDPDYDQWHKRSKLSVDLENNKQDNFADLDKVPQGRPF